ncbi:arylamine N-acetyltransferase family protein [Paenibacillus taiwanensis]|uniref:arylamine N-acetyltransferase family protein n=1 Tax=Paenibacillus taiwanensis TaxID=401638 RepID=UPI0003F642F5|nr:arylamine N-acetyltransferase [Paenibacillus taiwanensis]
MDNQSHRLQADAHAYLRRIGYDGELHPSVETLARLQECHLHTVPFENLDIMEGIPLSLEIPDLIDKVVHRRRGGYCFELNALFGWLLRELGFSVTNLISRFWRGDLYLPPMRSHHVLQVTIGAVSYLCDVGGGGGTPCRPILLQEGLVQEQGQECYCVLNDPQFGLVLCEWKQEEWKWIYSFTKEPQLPIDYIMATYWCEHAPESKFTQNLILALRTREGRHTVSGDEFRIYIGDEVTSFVPQSQKAYEEALLTYFGIEQAQNRMIHLNTQRR